MKLSMRLLTSAVVLYILKRRKWVKASVKETIVDLSCGTVQWKVNDILQATAYQHNLSEEEKEFVPYFEMFYVGETIEWISGSYL